MLGPADVVAFINAAEPPVAEVNGPYPIADFLEADGTLLKRIRRNGSRVFRRIVRRWSPA